MKYVLKDAQKKKGKTLFSQLFFSSGLEKEKENSFGTGFCGGSIIYAQVSIFQFPFFAFEQTPTLHQPAGPLCNTQVKLNIYF